MSTAERLVYINGEYVSEAEAKVSIFDSALMFGDMVFEQTRSFNKKLNLLRPHLDRLYRSIHYASIPVNLNIDEMENLVYETIRRNDAVFDEQDEYRVMLEVSRGLLSIYAEILQISTKPTVVISVIPVKWVVADLAPLYDTGVHAVTCSQRSIPARLLDPKVKSRSRLHYQMANLEVSRLKDPTAWALLMDEDGFITEGTGSNFFVVKNGKLLTSEPRNILRGVTRDHIMRVARNAKFEVIETNLERYDLLDADEAFFTGTSFSILPCTKVDGHAIGEGIMGQVTARLMDLWSSEVGVNFVEQAREFARSVAEERSLRKVASHTTGR